MSSKKQEFKPVIENQSTGVDWLTVTANDPPTQRLLFEVASAFLTDLKGEGNTQKVWKFHGYDGYVCAGFRWGARGDGSIVMLSGPMARDNFKAFLQLCPNPTRIDLALTITLAEPLEDVAVRAYEGATTDDDDKKRLTKKFSLIRNNEGGQTCYVGSRVSDQFGRVYDKGRENRESRIAGMPAGKIWRYEVEFKQYRAKRIGKQLLASIEGQDDIHAKIGATIERWFISRDIVCISFAYEHLPYFAEVSADLTDDERSLKWLSTQVSPTIGRLSKHGKKAEVYAALGLAPLTDE